MNFAIYFKKGLSPRTAKPLLLLLFSCLLLGTFTSEIAEAQSSRGIQINKVLGDGKDGRVWRNWKFSNTPSNAARFVARVRKLKGSNQTFLNLRFEGGNAFENGKQVFLEGTEAREVSWTISGPARSSTLVLNAYKGEVLVERATLIFATGNLPGRGGLKNSVYQNQNIPRNQAGWNRPQPKNYGNGVKYQQGYPRHQGHAGGTAPGVIAGSGSNYNQAPQGNVRQRCRQIRYRQPTIEVDRTRASGGLFSGKQRIEGSVLGTCIQEVAYYEEGRLKNRINVPYSDHFQRTPFSVQIRPGRNGEIRVYSSDGGSYRLNVDQAIGQPQQNNNSGGLLGGGLF